MLFALGFLAVFTIGGSPASSWPSVPSGHPALRHVLRRRAHPLRARRRRALQLFAAAYYWIPKMSGRMNERQAGHDPVPHLLLGFNLAFYPMHQLASKACPDAPITTSNRRVGTPEPHRDDSASTSIALPSRSTSFNFLSIVLKGGKIADDDPWEGDTSSGRRARRQPAYNFARIPIVHSARPLKEDVAPLKGARHGSRMSFGPVSRAGLPHARSVVPRRRLGAGVGCGRERLRTRLPGLAAVPRAVPTRSRHGDAASSGSTAPRRGRRPQPGRARRSHVPSHRTDRRVLDPDGDAGVLYVCRRCWAVSSSCSSSRTTWVTAHLANAEILLGPPPCSRSRSTGRRWRRAAINGPGPRCSSPRAVGTFVLMLTARTCRGADATNAHARRGLSVMTARSRLRRGGGAHGAPVGRRRRWRGAAARAGRRGAIAVRGTGPGRARCIHRVAFAAQIAVGAANPLSGFSRPWLWGTPGPRVAGVVPSPSRSPSSSWRPALPSRQLVSDMVANHEARRSCHCSPHRDRRCSLRRARFRLSRCSSATIGRGAAASGGASALITNFDRDIDELMRRTRRRPLPAHRVPDEWASGLGIVLKPSSRSRSYAVFATCSRRRSAIAGHALHNSCTRCGSSARPLQNIVIGGAAGAIPPLVGWAAVTGSLDLSAWLLFAIVFFWTPATSGRSRS